jgi:hypothetical protein
MKTAMKPTTCWRQLPALLAAGLLVLAGGSAWAQLPTVSSRAETWTGSGPPPERDAIERAQWEPWLLQREQDARSRQSLESLGQRALREQAQRNGSSVPGRPGLSDQEQAWREQQQLQREQWRQQRELTREDDQRQRQSQESLGQRALREQALGRAASPSGGQVSPPAQRPGRRDY